jgi:hypothetical protein
VRGRSRSTRELLLTKATAQCKSGIRRYTATHACRASIGAPLPASRPTPSPLAMRRRPPKSAAAARRTCPRLFLAGGHLREISTSGRAPACLGIAAEVASQGARCQHLRPCRMALQAPRSLAAMTRSTTQTTTGPRRQRARLSPAAFAWARVAALAPVGRLRAPRPTGQHPRRRWSARAPGRRGAPCYLTLIREGTERLVKRKGPRGRQAPPLLGQVRALVSAPARLARRVGAPSSLSINDKMPQPGGAGRAALVRVGLVRWIRQGLQATTRRAMARRKLFLPRTRTCGF